MRWTPDDIRVLREAYADETTLSVEAVAIRLGRPVHGVRTKAWRLGIYLKRHPWSADDLSIIRSVYEGAGRRGTVDIDALASRMGRLKSDVSRKAREMGLTSRHRKRSDSANRASSARQTLFIRMKGHPRGMAGKRHSETSRRRMSVSQRLAVVEGRRKPYRVTHKHRQALAELRVRTVAGGGAMYSRCKHGRRADLDNRFFRSAWEANYARFLNLLVMQGVVQKWEYEVDTFWFEKIRRGVRSYTPDFKVTEPNGHVRYDEVKGWMDAKSKTKLKRMKKYHPTVEIRVIDRKVYTEIAKKLGGAIPGWE